MHALRAAPNAKILYCATIARCRNTPVTDAPTDRFDQVSSNNGCRRTQTGTATSCPTRLVIWKRVYTRLLSIIFLLYPLGQKSPTEVLTCCLFDHRFSDMPLNANEEALLCEPSAEDVEYEHQRLVRVPGDDKKFGKWSLVALILVSTCHQL
jgi:hypothetical protein